VLHTDIRAEQNAAAVVGSKCARWLGGPLAVMKRQFCSMMMPDQVGFRVPTLGAPTTQAGAIVNLSERIPRRIHEELPITPLALTAGSTPQEMSTTGANVL